MKWLLCGLVTVEKFHGDNLPKNVGRMSRICTWDCKRWFCKDNGCIQFSIEGCLCKECGLVTLLPRDKSGRNGSKRAGVNELIDDQTRRRRAIAPLCLAAGCSVRAGAYPPSASRIGPEL
jgi:hypothetical protein